MGKLAVFASMVFLQAASAQTGERPKPFITEYVTANVGPVPQSLVTDLNLDPFYKKYTDALGIPVLSSEKVPDAALLVARDIVNHMLAKRWDLRAALISKRWRIGVMAQTEMTTDIPEMRNWKKPVIAARNLTAGERANYERIAKMTDKEYWDNRARGMGGNPTTCAEENLLGYYGTKYYGENIFVHEFSHAILNGAIRSVDPAMFEEVRQAHQDAMTAGRWKGQYGETNMNEYWAEATQTWFYSNFEFRGGGRVIQSPQDLEAYDPKINELLSRVYPDHHIPMDVYYGKEIKQMRRGAQQQKEASK